MAAYGNIVPYDTLENAVSCIWNLQFWSLKILLSHSG